MATVRERDRGQLILVAGLGLAVALVALALVLNSAIYTQNLASRNIESGANDGFEARQDASAGLGGLMDSTNDPTADYGSLEAAYQAGVEDWREHVAQTSALRGRSVRVETATDGAGNPILDRGVRVVDDDGTTDFSPRSTKLDWTVAPDVRARNFRMVVEDVSATPTDSEVEDELDDGTWTEGSFFYVDVDDGEWRMAVYGDGSGDVKVGVYDASADEYTVCSVSPVATPVRIDVGRGTVDSVPCEALTSIEDQTGLYTVHYANADKVQGSYELTADRAIEGTSSDVGAFTDETDRINYGRHCDGPTYYAPGNGNPYVGPALYSSEADVTFRGESVSYDSTVRVAADELSEGASSPQIRSITVDDQSGVSVTDTKFVVTVDVADPDGDLSEVSIELDRISTSFTETKTGAASGRTDTVTKTFDPSIALDTDFDITITVRDGAATPNERSVVQRHTSDGDGTGDGSCPE